MFRKIVFLVLGLVTVCSEKAVLDRRFFLLLSLDSPLYFLASIIHSTSDNYY